jgi:hypothetical protein
MIPAAAGWTVAPETPTSATLWICYPAYRPTHHRTPSDLGFYLREGAAVRVQFRAERASVAIRKLLGDSSGARKL